jgi:flagellar protein FliS
MAMRAHDTYVAETILSADPVELVHMLYRAAIESIEMARQQLEAGDIRGRSASITKAVEILSELSQSLNHENAPELSRRLAELYDYAQRRFLAANIEQADAPLAEGLRLLQTLLEAWKGVLAPAEKAFQPISATPRWNLPAAEPEPALHGWSF